MADQSYLSGRYHSNYFVIIKRLSVGFINRINIIEHQLPLKIMKYSKYMSCPLPTHAIQIINPFLNSRITANHDKVEKFQAMVKSL